LKKQRSALSKKHYNNARLKSDIGYSHPGACSPGVSGRSMPSGIGSWRRPENSGKFVGSRLHKERKGVISGKPTIDSSSEAGRSEFPIT